VWEGDVFVKSQIEVKAGSEVSAPAGDVSSSVARSIFDPEAEVPALEEETEDDSAESVVREGLEARAYEFPDVHVKVELLGEDGQSLNGRKKAVSVFSNVDYLLGRGRGRSGAGADEKRAKPGRSDAEDDESRQETREPVSIVFETNGRCEPHRILVWKDGQDEDQATVLEVDRFGAIKDPEADDEK
jgi:hypothetical protein